jgi:hypothetical protein
MTKKNVHPNKPAAKNRQASVKKNDWNNRNGAQAVDLGAVFQRKFLKYKAKNRLAQKRRILSTIV